MGESAVLAHSYSFAAPITRTDSHEDNTIHALSQSISFGKFMSENLEWGKWSTFSHKKYVEEAEKYSRPGSVAQKKAFFEAHYKRIAEAKKAATEEQPTVTPAEVLLHALETQPPLSLLPEEEPVEREEVPLVDVDDSLEEKKKQDEEEVVLKEDCFVGEKEKEKTKNKPVFRLSLEKIIPPAKPLEIASSEKISERHQMIQSSGVQRQKFSFLSCFIGNAKTRDQSQNMRKAERKNQKKKQFMCLCLKPKNIRES
ncbi:Transcriptional regulator ATRX-like protein [Hirschfeldia incana]|nr:Transcriptional regulator ATRX-like protein [Hirschfeldia incana]